MTNYRNKTLLRDRKRWRIEQIDELDEFYCTSKWIDTRLVRTTISKLKCDGKVWKEGRNKRDLLLGPTLCLCLDVDEPVKLCGMGKYEVTSSLPVTEVQQQEAAGRDKDQPGTFVPAPLVLVPGQDRHHLFRVSSDGFKHNIWWRWVLEIKRNDLNQT